jgi:hypothetical protein
MTMLKKECSFGVMLFLTILGVALNCKDMGDVPPNPLTANQLSVTLNPSGSTTLTISGGQPPYTISRQPDPSLATARLTNNSDRTGSLVIQAATANVSGTTTVRVKDTHSHGALDNPMNDENEIEITIRISANVISFASQVQPIFTANCVSAGCHPGGGAPFSLAAGESRNNLVGVDMLNGACGGKRVLAGDANASGLVKKLEGTCGSRMPLGSPTPLSPANIQVIRDWISQGAQNN